MKNLFFILLLITSFSIYSQKQNGEVKKYYSNGKLKEIINYKNGKKDGLKILYHENGEVQSESSYKEDKLDGIWNMYHENGDRFYKAIYKSGEPQGIITSWYVNGIVRYKHEYKNGKRWNILATNDINGKALYHGTFKDGNGTTYNYDKKDYFGDKGEGILYQIMTWKDGEVIKRDRDIETIKNAETNPSLVKKESNSYLEKIKKLRKINFYNINDIGKINSDCGAFFDKTTNTLSTKDECKGKFWMKNLRDSKTPYEFEMTFTPSSNYNNQKNTYLAQIILGNSPNGYTWIGFNKSGELLISTRNKKGWKDKLRVLKTDKVHFGKENNLKFIHFPDGIYYIELNSYSKWSFDLPAASQTIPLIGLSNRINFYIDMKLSKLNLNLYHKEDKFLTEMEDISANMQANQLLSIESDKERLKHRNAMKIMFNNPCYGNCKNGYGIYDYSNGMQYAGLWKNREYQGKGILYNNGVMYYKGSFENGKMNGYGVVYKDGEIIFKGQWKNGKPVR